MTSQSDPKLNIQNQPKGVSVVGWIELIDLPELKLNGVKAKFDTGARTSALHSREIETFTNDGGETWVRFHVQMQDTDPERWFEAPVHDIRSVKNTSGTPQERVIIKTPITIAGQTWPIEVSLTDRSNMRLPMIVGRTALKGRNIAVHTLQTKLSEI